MDKREFMVTLITLATSLEDVAQQLRKIVAAALDEENEERFGND